MKNQYNMNIKNLNPLLVSNLGLSIPWCWLFFIAKVRSRGTGGCRHATDTHALAECHERWVKLLAPMKPQKTEVFFGTSVHPKKWCQTRPCLQSFPTNHQVPGDLLMPSAALSSNVDTTLTAARLPRRSTLRRN